MKNQKSNTVFRIKEFSKMFGLHPDTIRNYTKKGILEDKRNPVNNYRIFNTRDVEKMKALTGIKPNII